jgi:sugar lactone lactonase YvrE
VQVDGGQQAYACALGGPDGRTLFVCAASSSQPADCIASRDGRIVTVPVEVPAAPLHAR